MSPAGNDLRNILFIHLFFQQTFAGVLPDFLFQFPDLFFESRNRSVTQLRRAVQVIFPFRFRQIAFCQLQTFAQSSDFGDGFLFRLPLTFQSGGLVFQVGEFLLKILPARFRRVIRLFFQCGELNFHSHAFPLDLVDLHGTGINLGSQLRRGFVDQVDRLVRQKTVRDILIGKRGGGDDRGILDFDPVMHFVTLLESAQNGNRILHTRLGNQNGLETAFQSGIFLDIFPVLVQCRRTDTMQFSARQQRFQQISGIHCALASGARPDYGVQLVDKQNNPSFRGRHFLQHGFQPLFEFAAVLGSGNQRPHVKGNQFLVFEPFRHVAAHDPVRQPFHDRGLADTRFSDQHRIVLRPARKNLNRTADLVIAPDHGIELILRGSRGQVTSIFFQRFKRGFGGIIGHPLISAYRFQRGENGIFINPKSFEQSGALLVGVDQCKKQMFHADVIIFHAFRNLFRLDKRLAEIARRVGLLRSRPADRRNTPQFLFNGKTESAVIHIHFFQKRRDQPPLLIRKSFEQMDRTDFLMAVFSRDTLGCDHRFSGFRRKFFHVHK